MNEQGIILIESDWFKDILNMIYFINMTSTGTRNSSFCSDHAQGGELRESRNR